MYTPLQFLGFNGDLTTMRAYRSECGNATIFAIRLSLTFGIGNAAHCTQDVLGGLPTHRIFPRVSLEWVCIELRLIQDWRSMTDLYFSDGAVATHTLDSVFTVYFWLNLRYSIN